MTRLLLVFLALTLAAAPSAPAPSGGSGGRELGKLAHPALSESSGIAPSRRQDNLYWTHNDSGDSSRIFAISGTGEDRGVFEIKSAANRDWEDISSFERDGRPYLLIADVGDNLYQYATHKLYIVPEPELPAAGAPAPAKLAPVQALEFGYEGDERHNCEGVAVDAPGKTIYLIEKLDQEGTAKPQEIRVFALPLPDLQPDGKLTAKVVAKVTLPTISALDITADGRRALFLTYTDAYEFTRGDAETWPQAFAKAPRRIPCPKRRKGEGACYTRDGKSLILCCEGKHAPLFAVPLP